MSHTRVTRDIPPWEHVHAMVDAELFPPDPEPLEDAPLQPDHLEV